MFHQVFQTLEKSKSTFGLQPHAFISFLETLGKHLPSLYYPINASRIIIFFYFLLLLKAQLQEQYKQYYIINYTYAYATLITI